jgi:hypothetical protein
MNERPPFNDIVYGEAQAFARELLDKVPELESIAVVPAFSIPQDRLPYGVIAARFGELQAPGEIMNLSTQLWGALRTTLMAAQGWIQATDQILGENAKKIQEQEQELCRLKTELESLRQNLAADNQLE